MADITAITPLANIDVDDDDLKLVKADIVSKYLHTTAGQSDFSEQIARAKRTLHVEIQERDGLTDAQMELVKDTELATMKDKIVLRTLSLIMFANDFDIMGDSYQRQSDKAATLYTLDSNEDDVQDASEVTKAPGPRFRR